MRAYLLLASACLLTAAEPHVSSIDPITGAKGKTYEAVVRGRNLAGAYGVVIATEGLQGRVLRVEPEPARAEDEGKKDAKIDRVHIQLSSAIAGSYGLRLLTPNGITNELSIRISEGEVVAETDAPDPIRAFPFAVTGRISERGEEDTYWIEAAAGQTLTFEAKSGHSSFDPLLAIFEAAPTWLDKGHMERIAFNDEPLFFPGLSTDAHLVHTFAEGGRYCLKVQSSTGQGSADSVYELRIVEGMIPAPVAHPKLKANAWEERQFTRTLSPRRQEELALRGGLPAKSETVETYRVAGAAPGVDRAVMRLPAIVEGRITRPAEAHRIKLRIEKAENIAIEIETREATMPRFNPVILLFEPGGAEVATNVYTKRNNNGLYMMKMIQPKVALPIHAPGDYEMEIRDITSDRAGDDFLYRVLLRRQIPHAGKIEIPDEGINLRRGATHSMDINIEREEGFDGLLVFDAEGLPAGVTAAPAAPKPIERPPLPNGGKLERYTPGLQNAVLVFIAGPDAVIGTAPIPVRIVARPLVKGKLGEPIVVKELPMMILPESTT